MQTRGLFALKISAPVNPVYDTFTWVVPLPPGSNAEDFRWFVDGSLFDEYKRFMRRTGFGAVAVDHHGALVACGYGVPPMWVHDAAGAELWAVCFVLGLRCHTVPSIVTDCKGIVDSLQYAPHTLTCHDKALARTWGMVRQQLDDDLQQLARRLTWMPSHAAYTSIEVAADSDGHPVTATMWRANRLVDALAKRAAGQHRMPQWALKQIEQAKNLALYSAAKLGVVTHRANHHTVQVVAGDGTITTRTCRDSTAEKQPTRPPRKPPGAASHGPLADFSAAAAPRQAVASQVARGTKRVATAWHSEAAAPAQKKRVLAKLHRLRCERQAEEQVANWLATWAARTKADPAGPTAAARMEALRARIRNRSANSVGSS
jgi:hypothetical protein